MIDKDCQVKLNKFNKLKDVLFVNDDIGHYYANKHLNNYIRKQIKRYVPNNKFNKFKFTTPNISINSQLDLKNFIQDYKYVHKVHSLYQQNKNNKISEQNMFNYIRTSQFKQNIMYKKVEPVLNNPIKSKSGFSLHLSKNKPINLQQQTPQLLTIQLQLIKKQRKKLKQITYNQDTYSKQLRYQIVKDKVKNINNYISNTFINKTFENRNSVTLDQTLNKIDIKQSANIYSLKKTNKLIKSQANIQSFIDQSIIKKKLNKKKNYLSQFSSLFFKLEQNRKKIRKFKIKYKKTLNMFDEMIEKDYQQHFIGQSLIPEPHKCRLSLNQLRKRKCKRNILQ